MSDTKQDIFEGMSTDERLKTLPEATQKLFHRTSDELKAIALTFKGPVSNIFSMEITRTIASLIVIGLVAPEDLPGIFQQIEKSVALTLAMKKEFSAIREASKAAEQAAQTGAQA